MEIIEMVTLSASGLVWAQCLCGSVLENPHMGSSLASSANCKNTFSDALETHSTSSSSTFLFVSNWMAKDKYHLSFYWKEIHSLLGETERVNGEGPS